MDESREFWVEAVAVRDSATLQVLSRVLKFTLFSVAVCVYDWWPSTPPVAIEVTPFEFAGAVLGILMVLRINAGYDRWWEGRKLWGGIVNQCRDLVIAALAYGPPDPQWRKSIVRWTAAYAHVVRRSLRGERSLPEVAELLGDDQARQISAADHMPSFVSQAIARLLHRAREQELLDPFAFLQIDRDRAALIDHVGGCERIVSAPLPKVYSIHIRRFILMYLVSLPFALLNNKVGYLWIPVITTLVAYPILSLEQIGVELQNPFSTQRLGHLPLDEITAKIEKNLEAQLHDVEV
jgi:ion channel-forming bestrophin family protein